MQKIKSEIEIQDQEKWLEDIEFEKIRDEEKYLLRYTKDKLNITLSNINKHNLEFWDEIKFGQFIFKYRVYGQEEIRIEISLKQQTAEHAVYLDDNQDDNKLISYLYLPPHQVFYCGFNLDYPIVRRLSEWDELQRLEDWVNDELQDWVLNKYKKELRKEGKSEEFIDDFCKTYKERQ